MKATLATWVKATLAPSPPGMVKLWLHLTLRLGLRPLLGLRRTLARPHPRLGLVLGLGLGLTLDLSKAKRVALEEAAKIDGCEVLG